MNAKIERLFRVPYKRLNLVKQALDKRKFGFIYEFTKESLFEGVDQADCAAEKAKSDFDAEVDREEVSPELLLAFRQAYWAYSEESRKVRDLVSDREGAVADFLSPFVSK
ncbi:MAG: hypothetical protein KME42_08615 [Tildeniella nuda ZEHNDER 1965/U140]|jgi:hypothetical protein|nr:hypothetical protein [Tildeniella nuda ZEHNDER 1965/U140]